MLGQRGHVVVPVRQHASVRVLEQDPKVAAAIGGAADQRHKQVHLHIDLERPQELHPELATEAHAAPQVDHSLGVGLLLVGPVLLEDALGQAGGHVHKCGGGPAVHDSVRVEHLAGHQELEVGRRAVVVVEIRILEHRIVVIGDPFEPHAGKHLSAVLGHQIGGEPGPSELWGIVHAGWLVGWR